MTSKITTPKIILYSVALVAVIAGAWWISLNFEKKTINANNPAFAKYITAYTSGVVSKTTKIKVQISNKTAKKLAEKTEIPKHLFKFSPKIEGKYILENQTLIFTPKETLKSGKKYIVEFNLDKIIPVSNDLKKFIFQFKTILQNFHVEVTEQITTDKKQLKYQQVKGIVHTADVLENKEISSLFSAEQQGEKRFIKWKTDLDKTAHYFTIDSIKRLEKESFVQMTWDASAIDIDKEGVENIKIPAIGDFNLLSWKVIQTPNQYLQLQFSDPLAPNQNLSGLINIEGLKDIRYEIDENVIRIYPAQRQKDLKKVSVSLNIKNIIDVKLGQNNNFLIAFEEIKPAVKFTDSGNILTSSEKGFVLPFEAVNLKAVDVTIIRIYENNVTQFLQVNELGGDYDLKRVGKPILQKTVSLQNFGIKDFSVWNTFTLDLSKLIKAEPGAIYRVELNFRKYQAIYSCQNDESNDENTDEITQQDWNDDNTQTSSWDAYEQEATSDSYDYWYDDNYYENQENPCNKAYYGKKRMVARNILASNIGIIAKKGTNGKMRVFVNDMLTTKPINAAKIEVFDFQNQLLASAESDMVGQANFENVKNAFVVSVKSQKQRGFLKISDGSALSLSRFQTSGTFVKGGLKGFIYGERGVWRPGDSLFLSFILKEESDPLPKNLPIVFEFKNPQGKLLKKEIQSKNKTGFYTFKTNTASNDITGNYSLKVTVGVAHFYKNLKIETIKPNRLKIRLKTANNLLQSGENMPAEIQAYWLHGAPANQLKVTVDATLKAIKTVFPNFSDYSFDDPTKNIAAEPEQIFNGKTDADGHLNFDLKLNAEKAPGLMNAVFLTRVYEKGGDFSTDSYTLPLSTYKSYIGIKTEKGDKARGMLLTDTKHVAKIVIANTKGNLKKVSREVTVKLYKLSWRWWWDDTANDVSSYSFKNSSEQIIEKKVAIKNGVGNFNFEIKYPDWGRYMVYALDPVSGHSAGKVVYIDWPGWAGRAQGGDSKGASMLMFEASKDKYSLGEEAKITFPSAADGRALISIENGTEVLESHWVETKNGETEFSFNIKKNMTPNVYVHITSLQKHAQTANDLPIRMYGVIPIKVENKETRLNPQISMPNKIESETTVQIKVSEKDDKKMTYTLAIVDEGLLDLTRFKTPNPRDDFFAKEALGVKTWDIYDDVIGAYAGGLERLLAIGGDANVDRESTGKANRFKPVALFFGPFTISGESKTHSVKIPKYIGAVRVMVVAGNNIAYGAAEKSVPVVKPLMVLGTLPRILSPGEKLSLPVNVFAMEKNIKNAKISVAIKGPLKIVGRSSKKLTFSEPGDKMINFDLEVLQHEGKATILISATGGGKSSSAEIEIEVRNPNSMVTVVLADVVEAGKSWETVFDLPGAMGANNATLEISSLPPINLQSRLSYLIQYPHGCVEQTTSAVFPQLYVSDLQDINTDMKTKIETNVKAAINKLQGFQLSNGGLGYWQNSTKVSLWGTNYAGHFLLEAKAKGYSVALNLLNKWTKFQGKKAINWSGTGGESELIQAYRLYTLALAGKPEKGAMNRLKETTTISVAARWRLAAAYALIGKISVAKSIAEDLSTEVSKYTLTSETFGSETRDKAMILETLILMNNNKKAFAILKDISVQLSGKEFLSTQSTAYALVAVAAYAKKNPAKGNIVYSYKLANGKLRKATSAKQMDRKTINVSNLKNGKISVVNNSKQTLYARFIMQGKPETWVNSPETKRGIAIVVNYKYPDGSTINPTDVKQGTDFIAEVVVSNQSNVNLKDLALSQLFPSGWEIINPRITDLKYGASSPLDFQDIRDDRVYTYFDLPKGGKKVFRILINASYIGDYWLPPVSCSAMYDENVQARKSGKHIKVTSM